MTLPNCAGVYAIRNGLDGKVYVGSTKNLRTRWNQHRSQLRNGTHDNGHLLLAWVRDGEEQFGLEVLELVPEELLREREQHWIDALRSADTGYNLHPKADSALGHRHSEETKQQLSDWRKLHPTTTDEGRAKMSATRKGRKPSRETVEKVATAHRGMRRSEEARANMRSAWARKRSEREAQLKILT